MITPGGVASAFAKVVTDTFTRSNSGPLGSANTGQIWRALRGTWSANGTQATSADAASNNSLTVVGHRANATVSGDTTGGVGLAFWVSDANSWWAAYPYYTTSSGSSCSGGTVSCQDSANTCTPSNSCGAISSSSTCTGPTTQCQDINSNNCVPANSCNSATSDGGHTVYTATNPTSYTCSELGYTQVGGGNCAGLPTGWQCCSYILYTRTANTLLYTRTSASLQSYTTYTSYVRVVSSVSGVVAVDSSTSVASGGYTPINSMSVNTNSSTITVTAYSSTGLVSQMGSPVVRTPTAPNTGALVGIVKSDGGSFQGTTLDNFSATV